MLSVRSKRAFTPLLEPILFIKAHQVYIGMWVWRSPQGKARRDVMVRLVGALQGVIVHAARVSENSFALWF